MSFNDKYGKTIRVDTDIKKKVFEYSKKTGLNMKKSAETLILKGLQST